MLNIEAIKKNFSPSEEFPFLLSCFLAFQNYWTACYLNHHLNYHLMVQLCDCTDAFNIWLGAENANLAKHFAVFACDGSKGLYNYWIYEGQSLQTAPIVYLDSGGAKYSTVVADSLEGFLTAILLDDANEFNKPFGVQIELLNWLKTKCGFQIVSASSDWIDAHPDFVEWFASKTQK